MNHEENHQKNRYQKVMIRRYLSKLRFISRRVCSISNIALFNRE